MKRIRLTEQDLHRIVKESVNRVLKESTLSNEEFREWATEAPSYLILDVVESYVDEETFNAIIQGVCDAIR